VRSDTTLKEINEVAVRGCSLRRWLAIASLLCAGDKSSMPSSVGGVGTGAGAGASGTRSRGHSFTSTARSESTSGATSRVQATLYKMPTLQSLFQSLPTHLAFDVEVKYPVETAHRLVVAPCSVDHCCSLWALGWGLLCFA
jgi:hypothetical protein